MEWDLIILAKWAILGLSGSTLGFAAAWVRARERAIRAEERTRDALTGGDAARLDRIEQAVIFVTLEVERLGAAQLYADRLPPAASSSPAVAPSQSRRVITPH
jgi:hypothetical protein